MGKHAREGLQPLSSFELTHFMRALRLDLPSDAIVKGVSWASSSADKHNYRVRVWLDQGQELPLSSTWIAEREGHVFRLLGRPATPDEIEMLYGALRELDALAEIDPGPIAEAHYDCRQRLYQLAFTPLEQMVEGLPYRRWFFRRHDDGRPLSVGYVCETRRGNGYATLPDGAVLRGDPWSPLR
jgi:hypothetical protein